MLQPQQLALFHVSASCACLKGGIVKADILFATLRLDFLNYFHYSAMEGIRLYSGLKRVHSVRRLVISIMIATDRRWRSTNIKPKVVGNFLIVVCSLNCLGCYNTNIKVTNVV